MLRRMTKTAEVSESTGPLVDLIKQVQAGNEVLLTQGHKPVARLVAASEKEVASGAMLKIHSLKGHRVLTPVLSQSELAEELFDRP
jgi:antitoxin (DNA-binding transcriptional repressor) of toxin-antitoxin stability system